MKFWKLGAVIVGGLGAIFAGIKINNAILDYMWLNDPKTQEQFDRFRQLEEEVKEMEFPIPVFEELDKGEAS